MIKEAIDMEKVEHVKGVTPQYSYGVQWRREERAEILPRSLTAAMRRYRCGWAVSLSFGADILREVNMSRRLWSA